MQNIKVDSQCTRKVKTTTEKIARVKHVSLVPESASCAQKKFYDNEVIIDLRSVGR